VGDLSEFSLSVRLFLRAYRWRRVDPVPWTPLEKPLAASRVALVSTAGLVAPGQAPFDRRVKGGDPSYREIGGEEEVAVLVDSHRSESYDHAGVERDRNLAFPLDRLRELVSHGRLGSVSPVHLSFMGSITAPGRLVRDSAPRAAARLVAADVDVAVLVPV
jgi:D-proline reductase (dithiol) PrdB